MAIPKEQRYTAEEFLAMTDEGRCELIDGYIVYISNTSEDHAEAQQNIA